MTAEHPLIAAFPHRTHVLRRPHDDTAREFSPSEAMREQGFGESA